MRKEKRHFRRRTFVFILCLLLLTGFNLPAYAEAEILPSDPAAGDSLTPDTVDSEQETSSLLADPDALYFDVDDFTITVHPADDTTKEYVEERQAEGVEPIRVEPVGESDETAKAMDALEKSSEESQTLTEPKAYQITLTEEEADPSLYTFSAELAPKPALLMEADSKAKEMEVQDPEGYFMLEAALSDGGVMEQPEPVSLSLDAGDVIPLTLTAQAGQVFATRTASMPNPKYTVSYYVNMTTADTSSSGSDQTLAIINTDNGGQNKGGNNPVNGKTPATKNMVLKKDGTTSIGGRTFNQYLPKTKTVRTKYYNDNSFNYYEAPNLSYMNKLVNNPDFTLASVKIGNKTYSCSDIDKILFTNRDSVVQNPPAGRIVIKITEGMNIELTYDEAKHNVAQNATFYDYRIFNANDDGTLPSGSQSDPIVTSSGGNATDNTGTARGINRNGNYTMNNLTAFNNGRLAFGNVNSGTHLGRNTWPQGNNASLNRYNNGTYGGCTFGLSSGLDKNGKIVYSNGVYAPKLFDDGTVSQKNGKKTFSGVNLNFSQTGDTHTLTSVSGGGLSAASLNKFTNLNYTQNLYSGGTQKVNLFTNNFWPLDSTSGFDIKSGAEGSPKYYKGWNWGTGKVGTHTLPMSDDSVAHNNLFGMNYEISFELTDDYIGPLEYTFFGDDDMWVFLYKDGEPQNAKKIVDIGGVHSSVGQFVNLWDYIPKESAYNANGGFKSKAGTYKLKFYYTERGLSGSTCYMQYTLPSVSSLKPPAENGSLEIRKDTINASDDAVYDFQIKLSKDGQALLDDYSGKITNADGTIADPQLLAHDDAVISLKAGQTALIDYLPSGTTYEVIELGVKQEDGSYQTAPEVYYSSDQKTYSKGNQASGTISAQTTAYFYCKNVYPFGYALSGTKQFDYASGAIPDKDHTFTFNIYESNEKGEKVKALEDQKQTLTFSKDLSSGSQQNFTAKFENLSVPDTFVQGTEKTQTVYYRIDETFDNSTPQVVYDKGYVLAKVTYTLGDDNKVTTHVTYAKFDENGEEVVKDGSNVGALFTNQYVGNIVLPETGSSGIPPYLIGGLLMALTGALIIGARKIKKRKI